MEMNGRGNDRHIKLGGVCGHHVIEPIPCSHVARRKIELFAEWGDFRQTRVAGGRPLNRSCGLEFRKDCVMAACISPEAGYGDPQGHRIRAQSFPFRRTIIRFSAQGGGMAWRHFLEAAQGRNCRFWTIRQR